MKTKAACACLYFSGMSQAHATRFEVGELSEGRVALDTKEGVTEPSLAEAVHGSATALRQLETPAQPGYKRRARLVRIKGWVVLGWSSACFL